MGKIRRIIGKNNKNYIKIKTLHEQNSVIFADPEEKRLKNEQTSMIYSFQVFSPNN